MSLTSKTENAIPSRTQGLTSKKEIYFGPKEQKEKKPYYVDEYLLKRLISIHSLALSYYDAMAQSFKGLKFEDINMEILQRLQDNDLSDFKQQFFAHIESELDKAGIRNELMRAKLREGTDAPWNEFAKSIQTNCEHVQRVRTMQPDARLDLNNYSVKNGSVVFSDTDKERMKAKQATVYLDSQAKQQFIMLTETILKDLNKLQVILQRNGMKSIFGRGRVFEIQESAQEQKIYFNKTIVNKIQQ